MQLDKQKIALDLEKYSEVFYHFWNYCNVDFTEAIPTAAVSFDKTGQCLKLSINPTFWAAKTYTQQLFILAHEMLHVYYKHGNKAKNLIKERRGDLMKIANVAMDLCVNRTLTTSFGFDRAEIDPENMFCWIDTVFKDKQESPDKYFEYYYNLIKDNAKVIKISTGKSGGNNLVDDHGGLGDMEDDEIDGILKEIADKTHGDEVKKFLEKAGEEPKDDKSPKSKQAGIQSGSQILKVKANRIYKRRWEAVIRKWMTKASGDNDFDQWVKKNRRFTLLDGDLLLPSENECWHKDLNRIKINFYMDVSGSTYHLAQRFFDAANSIPLNRFEVNLYQFDTQVREVKNNEVIGGGGTAFVPLEAHCLEIMNKTGKYPDACFCISDGMSYDKFNPLYPDRWHWFLTENYRNQIHKGCNFYNLSDFE